ncbi:hypothetical protein BSKO_09843 [Bryopsis sp. KO-2023]|nr:hypothetical protein BSKO_09843 [Bryopsis sp. KO-2023]
MTTKYGVFKEPTYIGIGDRYITKKESKSPEELGLNLKVTTQRTGKGNDATFDKFKALHEGEKFVDPHRLKLMESAEKRKKNISDHSWKMTSPMKRSTGLGDFYGTLQGKVSYVSVWERH